MLCIECLRYALNANDLHFTYYFSFRRKYDYENYLCSLLIEQSSVRRTAFAVRSFNVEVAQIRDLAINDIATQFRFQFWIDIVNDIFDEKKSGTITSGSQPIAYELNKCYLTSNKSLSKKWFKSLIESRNSDINLSNFPFSTLKDLETYFDHSLSPVFYLINEAAKSIYTSNATKSSSRSSTLQLKLDHIGNHVAKAQGYANILRGISHNAKYGRCYIPTEMLIKHKLSFEDLLRKLQTQAVKDVCFELATSSHQHLEKAKALCKDKDVHNWLSLFIPIIPIDRYLRRLQQSDFNAFDSKLMRREGSLPLRIWTNFKLMKYRLK
ncbi:NADH dehydrogenase (ubiquinone) complex I: assembly factor 6-like isoform X1 [Dinothrombium tinctorium]|uniref:NADH dehydrogenase (Ubiquinone) complex I: assembly factor 6-like isoform X1 n=1 Tax=Dinothrombium tinctorium TaxID=1965070 RepID=A0A443RDH6_9ACAR|nr:NADH dehydrogenase (ubiquinone) complex I: assembly factor 6-like isoform X1 [Dinothrombium tinctorium]